jgi:hypothetical protein
VSLQAARAERAWRVLQQDVRQEFGHLLQATYETWRTAHGYAAEARHRPPVETALLLCRHKTPLSEAQLKALRDTLRSWRHHETHPTLQDALQSCLDLITRDGKHLMGYGQVESLNL